MGGDCVRVALFLGVGGGRASSAWRSLPPGSGDLCLVARDLRHGGLFHSQVAAELLREERIPMSSASPLSPSKVSAVKKLAAKASGGVAMAWDGITLPSPQKRERMEHIDKALQKVRRHDKGDMELPSA